ncbi:unnamed protein product [Ixodes hexagonus]
MLSHETLLAFTTILGFVSSTDRPIIGILAQRYYGGGNFSANATYIAASYVKFVELAGARAVPVFIDEPDAYYVKLFNSVNGILFPGGSANLTISGYSRAGSILYKLAVQANDNGTHFPLWGTCLGFELLTVLTSGKSVLQACSAHDLAASLNMSADFRRSRLYDGLPKKLEKAVRTTPITYNAHSWCLTPENFSAFGLNSFYKALSTNRDQNGIVFISSMEGKLVPTRRFHALLPSSKIEFEDRLRQMEEGRWARRVTLILNLL